ncbi:MAG: conjugal transfer protein TraL [Deltaproteobacteria bacterium]|nr:conjugal transfer protein TraL [Deltaproteobacteria bacterium]
MKEFHCILQTKGGIGKSVAAAWLAQYLLNQGRAILAIECDQSNRTLSRYEQLETERLDLLDKDQQIDRRRFDALMERLVEDTEPTVIMDNGQASFVPLTRYLVECDALSLLEEAGRQSYVHCVVTGGQLGPSTLSGLEQILGALADSAQIVVWRNAHFGPIDEAAYQTVLEASGAALRDPVHLDRWSKPFEDDVQEMLQRFLTFNEAVQSPNLGLMTRQRLAMVQRRIFGELQYALAPEVGEVAHA